MCEQLTLSLLPDPIFFFKKTTSLVNTLIFHKIFISISYLLSSSAWPAHSTLFISTSVIVDGSGDCIHTDTGI